MSNPHSSPPSLQLICSAIFCVTLLSLSGLAMVLAIITCKYKIKSYWLNEKDSPSWQKGSKLLKIVLRIKISRNIKFFFKHKSNINTALFIDLHLLKNSKLMCKNVKKNNYFTLPLLIESAASSNDNACVEKRVKWLAHSSTINIYDQFFSWLP